MSCASNPPIYWAVLSSTPFQLCGPIPLEAMQRLRSHCWIFGWRWALIALCSDNILDHFQGAFQIYVLIRSLSLGPQPTAMKAQPLAKSCPAQSHIHRQDCQQGERGATEAWASSLVIRNHRCYNVIGIPTLSPELWRGRWALMRIAVQISLGEVTDKITSQQLWHSVAVPSRHFWVTQGDSRQFNC